jgi:pimeloyl-ACP methyl ester carboxylesterase
LVGVVLLAIVGGGWYFSSVLYEDGLRVDHELPEPRVTIIAIDEDTITLKQIPDAEEEENLDLSAIWGITNGRSYGQLGDVISSADGLVTREYTSIVGQQSVGQDMYLERAAFPFSPLDAYGLDFEQVEFISPIGKLDAWHVPASTNDWAVLVHGRAGNRAGSVRILDDLAAMNVHSLTIEYRNDVVAPPSESGLYDFGTTEWEDVEAAVQFALDNGANKIVLVGYSMGGGIVVSYQLKSELADRTVGMVLDAPMLNFGRTVDKGAQERSVPAPVTFMAKLFSTIRFGVDWGALDFLAHAGELSVPILLIHSDIDDTVPIETSIEFAGAAPDIVEFHTFSDVGHVASWNSYPDEYESLFREFVERVK